MFHIHVRVRPLFRWAGLLAAFAVLVTLVAGFGANSAEAIVRAGKSGSAGASSAHKEAFVPPLTAGLSGVAKALSSGQRLSKPLHASTGTGEGGWIDGAMQSNYDVDCITGDVVPVTTEFVGYWGTEDVTSPRVGDVYYGRVVVAGIGGSCAGPYAHVEVLLPPNTSFAMDSSNPVFCSMGDIESGEFTPLDQKSCPQTVEKGMYGWTFDTPSGDPWDLRDGKMVVVAFPLVSTKVMSGIATNSWLEAGVEALDGESDPWDNPKQGVFVAANTPSVQYDVRPSVVVTGTTLRLSATLLNHYTAGKAYFDLGTTTRYGTTGDTITISGNANAYTVYQNWSNLKPSTTYHWRVRFVAGGHTYTGADQTFTLRADGSVSNGSSATSTRTPSRRTPTPSRTATPLARNTPTATPSAVDLP